MSDKAPSAGTKVNLGADAPTKKEGAGAVNPESLAAQSSTFTESNLGGAPGSEATETQGHQAVPGSEEAQKHKKSHHKHHKKSKDEDDDPLRHQYSYGGPAPTYVNRQYQRYPGGPKGKDIHEGGFEGEGPGDSILAEPGSEMDPARVAEKRFGIVGRKEEGAQKANPTGQWRYGALLPET